ncbi:hypothetical protein [Streptomyces similanensis]|uniref:Uncharacterized protein n=1 Tax=Streptomyces similanensis TaxID=1274988 RepID=A0ABP9L8A5_9ACTN
MTRYGFAIKALPKGGKPFGADEDDETDEAAGGPPGEAVTAAAGDQPLTEPGGLPEDPAPTAEPAADPAVEDPAADTPPDGDGTGEEPDPAAQPPVDDARPWSGDMYDEGDETDPEAAYCAYAGSDGEQAWLDRDPDGTLTGWVRDATGQVWRYTDPDAWATDVDGAQMTRTHGPEGDDSMTDPAAPGTPSPPVDRGVQDPMFATQ